MVADTQSDLIRRIPWNSQRFREVRYTPFYQWPAPLKESALRIFQFNSVSAIARKVNNHKPHESPDYASAA